MLCFCFVSPCLYLNLCVEAPRLEFKLLHVFIIITFIIILVSICFVMKYCVHFKLLCPCICCGVREETPLCCASPCLRRSAIAPHPSAISPHPSRTRYNLRGSTCPPPNKENPLDHPSWQFKLPVTTICVGGLTWTTSTTTAWG